MEIIFIWSWKIDFVKINFICALPVRSYNFCLKRFSISCLFEIFRPLRLKLFTLYISRSCSCGVIIRRCFAFTRQKNSLRIVGRWSTSFLKSQLIVTLSNYTWNYISHSLHWNLFHCSCRFCVMNILWCRWLWYSHGIKENSDEYRNNAWSWNSCDSGRGVEDLYAEASTGKQYTAATASQSTSIIIKLIINVNLKLYINC